MIGFKFFKSSDLAFALCFDTDSKREFLCFCSDETLILNSDTFFLYSS